MNYCTLNNGIQIPMLGFGTYRIKDSLECEHTISEAVNCGYRLFDTAQYYGNEEAIGIGIKKCSINREDLFITTKVWFRNYEHGSCLASVENSMKKMGLNYIDMVLLHWPFGNVYSAWRDLEYLYKEEKIRAIGVSNFSPDRLIDLINFNEVIPAVNQIETNLLCQGSEDHKWMERYHVTHQAYAPLGHGHTSAFLSIPELMAIADAHGKSAAQITLKFFVQNGISVIPKSVHANRIRDNIDIFDFSLSSEEQNVLRKLDTGIPMIGNSKDPQKVEVAMTWT